MMSRFHSLLRIFVACGLVCLSAIGTASGQIGQAAPRKIAKVSMVSAIDAVVPGQPFDVALAFELTDGWHIYWQNPGDSGFPPSATWTLPTGFTAGALQFPVPMRHKAFGATTNILEDDPVLVVRLTPPATIDGDVVALVGSVTYLTCKKQCVRETANVRLVLPVAATDTSAKPANAELFEDARRRLPKTPGKHLTITPTLSTQTLKAGDTFELTLAVAIKRGLHIQSNKPLSPGLIATSLLFNRTTGLEFAAPLFPKPHIRNVPPIGKVSEFGGKLTIRVPVTVDEEPPDLPARLAGLMTYQACMESGQCFPPQTVAFSTVLGGAVKPQATTTKPAPSAEVPGTTEVTPPEAVAEGAPAPTGATDAPSETTRTGSAESKTASEDVVFDWPELPWSLDSLGIFGVLIACFGYGLLINATPCVLPLLSIKVMGFVQQARESRRRTLALGLSFGIGVVLFFVMLGFLAAGGTNVLQNPVAVIALGGVVLVLALSMLGVYTLQVPTAATKLEASIQKEGLLSSFGKGALAPVLGFACTAPFLAGAFGWATQQPPRVAFFAFLFSGLGMASPYVLLGANPKWLGFLPKPGNWMITFERIMGFVLLAVVILLIHPLAYHLGAEGIEWTIVFFVAIAMACGVLGMVNATMEATRIWRYRAGAAAIVVVAAFAIYGWQLPLGEARARQKALRQAVVSGMTAWDQGIPWRKWSPETVQQAVRSGKTVFVDFTSQYCTNCKINKAVATNTPAALAKMQTLGVVPLQGDFTDGDKAIFRVFQEYGQLGPPLNLIYPAGKPNAPIKLPTLFSLAELLDALETAGPSNVK